MKASLFCIIVLALCVAIAQGSQGNGLSRRSSSCLRLMIVSNNCNNHGYCSEGNNGWACKCHIGWGGRDCVKEIKPYTGRRQLSNGEDESMQGGPMRARKTLVRSLLKKLLKKN